MVAIGQTSEPADTVGLAHRHPDRLYATQPGVEASGPWTEAARKETHGGTGSRAKR